MAIRVCSPGIARTAFRARQARFRAVNVVVPGVALLLAALDFAVARAFAFAAVHKRVAIAVQVEGERVLVAPLIAALCKPIAVAVGVSGVVVSWAAVVFPVAAMMQVILARLEGFH